MNGNPQENKNKKHDRFIKNWLMQTDGRNDKKTTAEGLLT